MKILFNPIHLLMALVVFLSMLTYIASGEPNRRAHNELTENGSSKKFFDIARSKSYHGNFITQKHERSEHLPGNNNQTLSFALPKCCKHSKFKVDNRFQKLTKSLKIIRSCRAKNREKTCGSKIKSISNGEMQHTTQALIHGHVSGIDMASTAVATSNMREETQLNENEKVDRHWLEPMQYEMKNKKHNIKQAKIILPEKCLKAMMTYLNYYGRGAEDIQEYLGDLNLDRMKFIKVRDFCAKELKAYVGEVNPDVINSFILKEECANRPVDLLWDITDILGILNKCQYAAVSNNDYESETIFYEIKHLIRSQYDIKDYMITKFNEDVY